MRTTLVWATFVAILLAAFATVDLLAQPQAPPSRSGTPAGPPLGVRVIDVTYILDNYARLKQLNEQFKKDVEDKEAQLKKERELIQKKVEAMKSLKPGTPDYKKKEEEIAQADSDWKIKVQRQRNDFAERESKNYLAAYQDIAKQVQNYSDRNGISLVLRFNGQRPDPANRDAVQAEVFKMVMYYHKDIDITDPILAELNRGAVAAGGVAKPPARPQQPVQR